MNCAKCGRPVPDWTDICPACGHVMTGPAARPELAGLKYTDHIMDPQTVRRKIEEQADGRKREAARMRLLIAVPVVLSVLAAVIIIRSLIP